MYKLCKKLIASILCLSFFSLQMSLAGSFDGTEVLPGVGGGAGADIKQATDGLTGIKGAGSNNATLEFGKDTIIDWGHFNVGNGQTLNFENGTFAVLNNVLSGMSTIAGQITGQQGTIIISNPNGMLMTAGGSINTSGALILTTQDMRNATLTDGKLNINDLLSNSEFKNNTYSIISLNAGKIAGADINIISKGINVINGSDITSSGNIAFTTSDGANFVANHRGATLPSGYSINIANSSLKTKDGTGTITLKADGANLKIQNSTFNAKDTNVSGKNIVIDTKIENGKAVPVSGSYTNVNGNLSLDTDGIALVSNTNIQGNTKVRVGKNVELHSIETNNLTVDADEDIRITNSSVGGDLKAVAGKTTKTASNSDDIFNYNRMFYMENTNVDGNLNASSETGYVHLNGGSVSGNATLAGNTRGDGAMGHIIIGYDGTNKSEIYANPEAHENSTVIKGTINAVAKKGYRETYGEGDIIAYSAKNLVFAGGSADNNATIKSDKSIIFNLDKNTYTNIGGNFTADAGVSDVIFNVNVGGDSLINSGYYQAIDNLETTNLEANAGYDIKLANSNIHGNVKAVAGKAKEDTFKKPYDRMFYMENTNVDGNLNASSETGYIHLNGGSVSGNATLAGNTRGDGAMGHIIIGYDGTNKSAIYANPEVHENSTIIKGTINAIAKKGYRETYGEGDIIAYSAENLVFVGGSADHSATIKSDKSIIFNLDKDTSTNIGGNFTADAGVSDVIFNVNVSGDSLINSGYYQAIDNLTTNNLETNAGYDIKLANSDVKGNVKAIAGKAKEDIYNKPDYRMFYMENTNVGGNLNASSETGYVHLNGGSVVGNAILAGNTRGDGANGHIIIGYEGNSLREIMSDLEGHKNSTVIGGTITATAKDCSNGNRGLILAYSDKDLQFINSSADNSFTAESAEGNVDVRNSKTGLNTDLKAGADINYIQSTTNGRFDAKSSGGNITVNESEIKGKAVMTAETGDVSTTASKYGSTADLKAGHDVNFILNDITGKLDAEADNDVNYVTKGDINLNEAQSAKLAIRAGNTAHIKTIDGNITVDSIKADTEVVKGKNIHLTADNDITFVGDNVINGNLIATSASGNGFVAINGNSTKANNITVDKAKWIEIKNVETGHLNLSNFIIGHLIQSTFDSTEASNCSDTLYVHRLNTKVNGYDVVEDAITPTVAESVNNLIYYPYFPEEEPTDPVDPNYTDSDDAARILGYMREQGIDGTLGKDYAPIGFAAYDRAKRGTIYRAAGDAIYKDISQTVHVTKRFDLD